MKCNALMSALSPCSACGTACVHQVEEPYDPERSLYYPLELSLELERDMGDLGDDFDVEDCKT